MDNKILLKIYTYTGYSLIISLFYFAPIFLLYFLKDNIGIGSYIIAYLMIFYLTFIIDTVFKRSAVKDKINIERNINRGLVSVAILFVLHLLCLFISENPADVFFLAILPLSIIALYLIFYEQMKYNK